MKKTELLTLGIVFSIILCLFSVNPEQITIFNNSLSEENLYFSGNETITRYLNIFYLANVTSANINISGYSMDNASNIIPYAVTPNTAWTNYDKMYDGLTSSDGYYAVSGTYFNTFLAEKYYVNVSSGLNITFKYRLVTGNHVNCNVTYQVGLFNQTLNSYDKVFVIQYIGANNDSGVQYGNVNDTSMEYYKNGVLNMIHTTKMTCGGLTCTTYFYDSWINYTGQPYINHTRIIINNTDIWNYTGEFLHENNKTSNFTSILNSALDNEKCNCDGCDLTENNCSIPFKFFSNTSGKLKYFDININWEEYINPNLTINSPIGTAGSRTFAVNINAEDDWALSYCYFNITRGASLEVSNTQIIDCNNKEISVSTDGDYIVHVYINDTSGNFNYSNSSFSIDTSGVVSGGGGGAAPLKKLMEITKTPFCDAIYPDFIEVWENFKKNKTYENFKILWFAFWNYGMCKSAASFAPMYNITEIQKGF